MLKKQMLYSSLKYGIIGVIGNMHSFLYQDFDDKNGSDCVGFQVEAITILETEKSYVNILLGKYDVPEVGLILYFSY